VGQKVHPLGFRLNTTQKHKSIWFAQLNQYSALLEQDEIIRHYITPNNDSAVIAAIELDRTWRLTHLSSQMYVAKQVLIITESGSGLIDLTKKLKALLPRVNKISIDVFEIMEPDTHAILLAQFIANQLVRRVAFKRAVRKAIERAQANDEIQGIKVQVGGRLNGAEIARTEWVKEGRMPLQTLRAKIDYATASAKTIYGILGVKVWLFKGEAMS